MTCFRIRITMLAYLLLYKFPASIGVIDYSPSLSHKYSLPSPPNRKALWVSAGISDCWIAIFFPSQINCFSLWLFSFRLIVSTHDLLSTQICYTVFVTDTKNSSGLNEGEVYFFVVYHLEVGGLGLFWWVVLLSHPSFVWSKCLILF